MAVERAKVDGELALRAAVEVRPLMPADAPALAKLEADTYRAGMRAGARQLARDLAEGAWDDSHLGHGLFVGGELVGMLLLYYEADWRRLFGYFDVPCPPDLQPEECLYVADFVVRREHSRYTVRLLKEVWTNNHAYHGLPIVGFSARGAFDRWLARRKAFRRLGYDYAGMQRFDLPGPPHEIYLVRFEFNGAPEYRVERQPGLRVEAIKTHAGWASLAPCWDELLHQTPDWTAFQSFEMQRLWWRHFAENSRLLILVARDGERVRAIAPLRIRPRLYWGRPRRQLAFIGDHEEVDRPTILRRGDDREAVAAIFTELAAHRGQWDALMLYEQLPDDAVTAAARQFLTEQRMLIGTTPGPVCPWADLTGTWQAFLDGKSRSFRKGLKRKRERLAEQGAVRFVTSERWPDVRDAFEAYVAVEAQSWKPAQRQGVAKSPVALAYHREMVERLGPLGRVHVRLLLLDEQPIAATFGLLDRGQFLSLHIAHDRRYDEFSPGVLLTAYELEEAYGRGDYARYELLGGFLNNKLTWASEGRETLQIYGYGRGPLFRLHYAWHFKLEPALKRLLRRLGVLDQAVRLRRALRRLGPADPAET